MPSNTPKNATPAAIDSHCGLSLRAATLNRVPPPVAVHNHHDPTGRANDPVDVTILMHRSERTHHAGMSSRAEAGLSGPAFVRSGRELTLVKVPPTRVMVPPKCRGARQRSASHALAE